MTETAAPDHLVREHRYRDEYLQWVASLPPADREALRKLGLDRPKIETTRLAYARPEAFRDSTGAVGMFAEDRPHDWQHPGDMIDGDEPEPVDRSDLEKLGAYDPELIKVLIRVLVMSGRGFNPKTMTCKLVALCHCLHVPGIGDKSLEELADKLGVTRQLLSYYTTSFRDFGKLDHRSGKSDHARDILSRARTVPSTARQRANAIEAGITTRHRGSLRDSRTKRKDKVNDKVGMG